ncbi:hypothetical protein KMW28_06200 [Flammeovirga yaeyamensis]|uniref:Phosphatidylinositol-4-phosphate 5-kinase n=1 Tax=Flammeovirga yaeyamensis TaxID=367791 RepID=A0AAX1N6S5_9BACT|nr:hypothetical protein [Flammeovirga yaeyamensis]MBB3697763.1 hypothetical protein [Flammeovirga yaeyamensis]NMF35881.1 hypothetical protein [Flammeovirga yaeyamensis]QWG03169.1 hypothetical protein KMW28_06200 [Flammeovirga yaeyamensis]
MKKILYTIPSLIILIVVGFYMKSQIEELEKEVLVLEEKNDELEKLSLKNKADSLLISHNFTEALIHYQTLDSIHQTSAHTDKAMEYISSQKVPYNKINELEERYYHKENHISELRFNQDELSDSIYYLKKVNRTLTIDKGHLESDLFKNYKEIKNLKKELDLKDKQINRLDIINFDGAEIKYIGEVRNEEANGFGYAVFEKKGFYEGLWEDNMQNGKGIYTWANGDRYEGNYKNGIRDGFGVYYFQSGERYEGFWANNLRDGFGVIFDKDNKKIYEGVWKKDKPKGNKKGKGEKEM